jgi:hypothetical protein
MEQNKFLKIFAISAYLVLMFVSCWATVESLRLLLPSWPVVFFWAVSVIFFVVASMGTKLIVDSFNQRVRIDNRGWRLIGGILLLTVFWIIFFLPTNTHTFFYRSVIKDVLVDELTNTKGLLQNLSDEGEAGRIIEQEKNDFRNKIAALFANYSSEINNPGLIGSGERADNVLIEMEKELGPIQRLILRSNSLHDRRIFLDEMGRLITVLLESKLTTYDTKLRNINSGLDKKSIRKLITEIQKIQNKISVMPTSNDEPTQLTRDILTQSFAIINQYSDVLKQTYPNARVLLAYPLPMIVKLDSVVEVWKEFFAGKYADRGFVFWIIIAALIDIAGFIFFDIAFKNRD